MPKGRVQRVDDVEGRAYIVRNGRAYIAQLADVESQARVPSAPVDFLVKRRDGQEFAEKVTLRQGTRTSRRQRRFGDLTGARTPGAKIDTGAMARLGVDTSTPSLEVVRAWLGALEEERYDDLLSLYRPDAVLHLDGDRIAGRRHLRGHLERCAAADQAVLHGTEAGGTTECLVDGTRTSMVFAVTKGVIVEQWFGEGPEPDEQIDHPEELDVHVTTRGEVDPEHVEYGVDRLQRVEHLLDPRTPEIWLTLSTTSSPDTPSRAEASTAQQGRPIRAHASEATMHEAINHLVDRLAARLDHHPDRHRSAAGMPPEPGQWRRGNVAPPPPHVELAVGDRELVRHKSYAPDALTVEEAAWDMSLLDYDFFLFVESESGADSLLTIEDDGSLVFHQLSEADPPIELPTTIRRAGGAVATLTTDEALDYLNMTGDPWLFHRNRRSGRADVVYRRYDGHYGVIATPDAPDPDPDTP